MTDVNTPNREGDNGNHDLMRYAPYIGAGAFALLFVLFAVYRPSLVSMSSAPTGPTGPVLPTKLDREDAATAADVALGRTLLESQRQQLEQAHAKYAEFKEEADRWDAEVTPLLTSDDGRFLAADEELVKAFDMLYSKNRPSRDDVATTLAKVEPVREFIEASIADPRLMLAPRKEIPEVISFVLEKLTVAIQTYRDDRKTILASVEAARHSGEMADQTLGAALDALHQRYATERMRLFAEKREQFERENRKQLAEVEYRKAREIGDAEAAKKEAEMEAERMRIQTAAELAAEKAEADRLLARANDPAVHAKYAPFLKKGRTVLATRGMKQYYWTPKNGPSMPASLSDLKHKHVFEGVERFVGAATAQGNDRGSWPYPASNKDWQRYREMLLEFNELAPTWVKLGVLNP